MEKEKEKVRIKDVLKKERFFIISNDYHVFIIDSHYQSFIDISEVGFTEDIQKNHLFVKDWYDINAWNNKNEKDKTLRNLVSEYNNKHEIEKGNFNWSNDRQKPNTNYYGGESNTYEAIKVITAHDLCFCLGNVVKYVLRAGKKNKETEIEDLEKAKNYIDYRIKELRLEK
jgi:hypothetical protein